MIDRRKFSIGSASAAALPAAKLSLIGSGAFGQSLDDEVAGQALWLNYRRISTSSRSLGLAVPRLQSVPEKFDAAEALPAFSDLLDNIEQSAAADGIKSEAVETLIEDAAELVRSALALERSPPDAAVPGKVRGLSPEVKRPKLDTLQNDYEKLFSTCKIRKDKRATLGWYLGRLKDPIARNRYEEVAEQACAPWYFVGIIHAMEASFNFRSHLHNGDSLKRRTTNVPAGRPAVGAPPFDWADSAIDAMKHDKLADLSDWSLAAMLYRWESYNGFRSRVLHKINTPYLWSFSNHYTRGKYVRDGIWSAKVVSKQCGAAVMLKALVEEGVATLPG